jgi:hypothetical protein
MRQLRCQAWLLVVLGLLGLEGCDRYVVVEGVVHNPSGVPLESVIVTLITPGRPPDIAKTPGNGKFTVSIVNADPVKAHVTFVKQGFETQDRSLEGRADWTMAITLIPRPNP